MAPDSARAFSPQTFQSTYKYMRNTSLTSRKAPSCGVPSSHATDWTRRTTTSLPFANQNKSISNRQIAFINIRCCRTCSHTHAPPSWTIRPGGLASPFSSVASRLWSLSSTSPLHNNIIVDEATLGQGRTVWVLNLIFNLATNSGLQPSSAPSREDPLARPSSKQNPSYWGLHRANMPYILNARPRSKQSN